MITPYSFTIGYGSYYAFAYHYCLRKTWDHALLFLKLFFLNCQLQDKNFENCLFIWKGLVTRLLLNIFLNVPALFLRLMTHFSLLAYVKTIASLFYWHALYFQIWNSWNMEASKNNTYTDPIEWVRYWTVFLY